MDFEFQYCIVQLILDKVLVTELSRLFQYHMVQLKQLLLKQSLLKT